MSEKKSFWTTVPGILTGMAAMITAIGGLLLVLYQINIIEPNRSSGGETTGPGPGPPPPPPVIYEGPDDAVKKAWEILSEQRGNLTDAADDRIVFQGVVIENGRPQHTYTLDFGGKQGFGRFVITVINEYFHPQTPEITYHYKEFTTSLEEGEGIFHRSGRARKIKDTDDKWEEISDRPDGFDEPKSPRIEPEDEKRIRRLVHEIVAEQFGTSLDEVSEKTQIFYPDSLDTLEILMELNEKFDVSIPDEQAKKIRTVEDAIDCIINLTKSKNQE